MAERGEAFHMKMRAALEACECEECEDRRAHLRSLEAEVAQIRGCCRGPRDDVNSAPDRRPTCAGCTRLLNEDGLCEKCDACPRCSIYRGELETATCPPYCEHLARLTSAKQSVCAHEDDNGPFFFRCRKCGLTDDFGGSA